MDCKLRTVHCSLCTADYGLCYLIKEGGLGCVSRVCPVWSRLRLRKVEVSVSIWLSVRIVKKKSLYHTLCHVLRCTTWKEITKCTVYGHGEVMYGNSHAHIKSDVWSATTARKLKYRKKTCSSCISRNGMSLFHMRNIWYNTSEGSIILWWRDKDFSIENLLRETWAQGWWQHGSVHQHTYQKSDAIY